MAGISTQVTYAQVYVVVDSATSVTELNKNNNTGLMSVRLPYASGSLTVTIVPREAVAASVQWSIDGGITWHAGGTSVVLPSGIYTIIFKSVPGWILPTICNVVIGGSESVSLTGNHNLTGDMNGDGIVDLKDVIIALQVINGIKVSPIGAWYNVNGDGKIGIAEAIYAIQKSGGL